MFVRAYTKALNRNLIAHPRHQADTAFFTNVCKLGVVPYRSLCPLEHLQTRTIRDLGLPIFTVDVRVDNPAQTLLHCAIEADGHNEPKIHNLHKGASVSALFNVVSARLAVSELVQFVAQCRWQVYWLDYRERTHLA